MIAGTPGSRSAQLPPAVLIIRTGIACVFQWVLLTGIYALFDHAVQLSLWARFVRRLYSPDALIAWGVILAAQILRHRLKQVSAASWPWVIFVFVGGFAVDIAVLPADHLRTAGTVAAIVYVLMFTRWFTGKSDAAGEK